MISDQSEMQRISVQFRMQRVTTEYCYVNVPVTSDVIIRQSDGTGKLNVDAMVARGEKISRSTGVKWYVEAQELSPHPVQKPMEPGEERYQGEFPEEC